MHILDILYLGVASGLVMLAFVAQTNIEKSKVKIKVKAKKNK